MYPNSFTTKKTDEIVKKMKEQKIHFALFRGSIGVGKTMLAKTIAKKLIENNTETKEEPTEKDSDSKFIKVVPFHAGTDYGNLVHGISVKTENGKLLFHDVAQIFIEMLSAANDAANKDPKNNYVLILDDINRGDFSRAMGDILSAIESANVGGEIYIPQKDTTYKLTDNFYLLATMNPVIGNPNVDYAWLRRFYIFDIFSDERYIEESVETIIKRNKIQGEVENFKNEYPRNKFIDYVYELYMQIKVMFSRYFLENDENIKQQYMLGHGMFLTWDEDKNFSENAKRFSYQLRYCIVPLLYQYVNDGLLDKKALIDIETLENLYNFDKTYWNSQDKENDVRLQDLKARGKEKPYLVNFVKNLIGTMPDSAAFRFFMQNYSLISKTPNGIKFFLFEHENFGEYLISCLNGKDCLTPSQYITVQGIKYYSFGNARKTFDADNMPKEEDKAYEPEDLVSASQVMFRMFKVFIRILEFDCRVRNFDFTILSERISEIVEEMSEYIESKEKRKVKRYEMIGAIADKCVEMGNYYHILVTEQDNTARMN